MEAIPSTEFKTKIHLSQESENSPATFVLVHQPSREVFMSSLHPAASLYEDTTDENSIRECFRNLKEILSKRGIILETVKGALCKDRKTLEELAFQSLKYVKVDDSSNSNSSELANQRFDYYTSEDYKRTIINHLNEDQLADVIFTQPTIQIKRTDMNTFVESSSVSFAPLGNLVFCRDQQITTRKGVVIGRLRSSQRAFETVVLEHVYKSLGANIVGKIPNDAYLEGGDYFVAKPDLSMCGVGLRTTVAGVNYLMENDLLGTDRFAIVYDEDDLDQQRMHLDTYFNILNKKYVVALDFDEVAKVAKKKVQRRVFLYSNKDVNEVDSGKEEIKKKVGDYHLVKIFENFYEYLAYEGFQVIKVSNQEQIDYMINFLNIGNNTVLCVNRDLKRKVKEAGVNVIFVEFEPILKMFGALHCATQVSRKDVEGKS